MKTCDRSRLALSASVLAWLSCCVSPAAVLKPIEHPDQPIQRLGFVLYPPAEGKWSMAEKPDGYRTHIILGEFLEPSATSEKIRPTTAISIQIARTPPEEFAKLFASPHVALEELSKECAQPSTGRFKTLASDTTWGQLRGQEFVRVVRRDEERDNPIDPSAVLVLESRSTWIFHPTQPTSSMRVLISRRSLEGDGMPAITDLEENFFSKLSFSP